MALEDQMPERRRSVRQKCRLRGRVYFNNGRNWANCLIRDISYEGARIVFTNRVKIPDAFLLAIPAKNRMLHANVRWRHGNRIGIVFSAADVLDPSIARPSPPKGRLREQREGVR
jgi:hypothetical protein